MTVSPDPLTNVTVTLPFPWLAGWQCRRQQDWITTPSPSGTAESKQSKMPVSWTKTSPGDLQQGSNPFQTTGAWLRNILVLRSRETAQFQKKTLAAMALHQGFQRITSYTQSNRHRQQAFLPCAALGSAQTHCNSATPHPNPMRLGSAWSLAHQVGPSCLWGTTWASPKRYLPETILSLLLAWYPSAALSKMINRWWAQIFIYC